MDKPLGNVAELERAGDKANKAIAEVGLVKAASILGEGFCPICLTRSAQEPVFADYDADPERPAEAVVNCATCQLLWRTGPNPDNPSVPVWIEHTREWNHMFMTMALNPPAEPPEEKYDPWD